MGPVGAAAVDAILCSLVSALKDVRGRKCEGVKAGGASNMVQLDGRVNRYNLLQRCVVTQSEGYGYIMVS